MSDWFDPQSWMPRVADSWPSGSWDAESWTRAQAPGMGAPASPIGDLSSLAVGRTIEMSTFSGTITSLEVTPAWTPALSTRSRGEVFDQVSIALDEVTWSGRRVDRVEIAAARVRYEWSPGPRVLSGPVEVQADVPLASFGRWLEERVEHVELDADPTIDPAANDGVDVRFRYRRLPVQVRLRPRVTAESAVIVVRELRCLGCRIPVPSRFPLAVDVPIELPAGSRLTSATLGDGILSVGLVVDEVEWPIDVRRLADRLRGDSHSVDVSETPRAATTTATTTAAGRRHDG